MAPTKIVQNQGTLRGFLRAHDVPNAVLAIEDCEAVSITALDALTKVSIENQVLGSFWPIVDVVAGITAKGILTSGSSRIWNLLYNLGVRGLWGPL